MAVLAVIASAIAVTIDTTTQAGGGTAHRFGEFVGFWLDVNNERNLPSWYSSVLLAVVALVASDVARVERSRRLTPWWGWASLAVIFVGLSVDELLQMHEQSSVVSALLLPMAVVFAIASMPLLWKLPRRIAYQLVGAGVIFVVGAAGLDHLGINFADVNLVLVHIEEGAEMIGVALLLAAIAEYREVLDDRPVTEPGATRRSARTGGRRAARTHALSREA